MSQKLHIHSLGNGCPIEIQGCQFEKPVYQQSYKEQYDHSRMQQAKDCSPGKQSNHHWTRQRTLPPRFQTSPAAGRAPAGKVNIPLSPMANEKTHIHMSPSAVIHQPLSPAANNVSPSTKQQPQSPTMINPHSPTLAHPPGFSQPLMKPLPYLQMCALPNLQSNQYCKPPSYKSVPPASPQQFPLNADQQPSWTSDNIASTYKDHQHQSLPMTDHAIQQHQYEPPNGECGSPISQNFSMQHHKPVRVKTNLGSQQLMSASTAVDSHCPNPLQLSPGPQCVAQQMGAPPATLYNGISLINYHPLAGQGAYAPPPWCMHPTMERMDHIGRCPQPGMLSMAIDGVMPINFQHPFGNPVHDHHLQNHQHSPMRLPMQMSPLNYFTFGQAQDLSYPPYEQPHPPPQPPQSLPPPYSPLHLPSPPRPSFPSPFHPPFPASSPLTMPSGHVPLSQLLEESEQLKNCTQWNANLCSGPLSVQEQSNAIREQQQQQQQQPAGITSEEQSAVSEDASVNVVSEHVKNEGDETFLPNQSVCPVEEIDGSRENTNSTLNSEVQLLDDAVEEDLGSCWDLAKDTECPGMNMSCSVYFYQMLTQLSEFRVCSAKSNQKSRQTLVPQALDKDLDQKFFLPSEVLALI